MESALKPKLLFSSNRDRERVRVREPLYPAVIGTAKQQ